MTNVATESMSTRWVRLIAKLIELTQTGALEWNADATGGPLLPTERIIESYSTTYSGQKIRIARVATKYFSDEDRFDWVQSVVVQLVDDSARGAFDIPQVTGVVELLDAVRYKTLRVDDFLKRAGV